MDCFAARLLAAAARLRADSAMLVHAGMPLTFFAARAACLCTCFNGGYDHPFVAAGPASGDIARCEADLGAVEIEANALPKIGDHVLG